MSTNDKLIINAAITGCVLTTRQAPALPVTIEQITETALRVRDAGASIVHLHARNADQSPCFDESVYCDLVDSVREACDDIVICVSLSGRHARDMNVRAAALASRPDMASLTLGSMNFATGPSVNSPETIKQLAERIYEAGAIPELEVFEAGFVHFAGYLARKELLRPPYYFNIILGSLGSAPLDLIGLGHMLTMLPEGAIWACGGLGQYQLPANVMAIAAGGHVRVGLEDNIHYDSSKRDPTDNEQLVARVARIAREVGREPASAAEAREIIGLGVPVS
jgi:3-keto-5-aminohexanoate cleavage enzyme